MVTKSYYLLNYSLFFLFTFLISGYTNAQFRDAATPSYSSGTSPIFCENTGNDNLKFNNNQFEVSVWEDNMGGNSGMMWKVGNLSGVTQIGNGSDIVDPDVCLVKNALGNVYALVVYFHAGMNEFHMQEFYWNPPVQQFTSSNTVVLSPGMFGNSINIASNDVGAFAIVWDEPGNLIRMVTGLTSGASPPVLSNGGNFFDLAPGKAPDVCVYRDGQTNYSQVNVTYIEPTGYILVDFYSLTELVNGILNPDPFYRSPAPDLIYQNPRIACPSSSAGNANDFTVVCEDTDGNSTWLIKSFNSNACCTPPFNLMIYNDGTTGNSPFNLSNVPNFKPVVTYDDQYLMTWVSWNVDNSWGLISSPGATVSTFPVAVAANRKALLYPNTSYYYVPEGNNFGSSSFAVSLSGNKSDKAFFTYYNEVNFDVYAKSILHTQFPLQLRAMVPEINYDLSEWLSELQYQQHSDHINYSINVIDLSGRLIYSEGNMSIRSETELVRFLRNVISSEGVYLLDLSVPNHKLNPYHGLNFISPAR
jgi:hypothetical protein